LSEAVWQGVNSRTDSGSSALLAAALLVADRLMGCSLAAVGVIEADALICGQIDVPTHQSFADWLSSIDDARQHWRHTPVSASPPLENSLVADRRSDRPSVEVAVVDSLDVVEARLATTPARPGIILGMSSPNAGSCAWRLGIDFESGFIATDLAEKFLGRVQAALEYILAHPSRPVNSFALLSRDEIAELIQREEGPALTLALTPSEQAEGAREGSEIVQLFDAQTLRNSQAQALAWEGGALSYLELQKRSHVIALRLMTEGVAEGELVPLLTARTPDTYAAILAILRCGAAYVPLDPTWPVGRIQALLREIGAKILVSPDPGATSKLAVVNSSDLKVFVLQQGFSEAPTDWTPLQFQKQPTTAYVMFTSGSTGAPKGVVIPQRAVVRLIANTQYLQLDANTRMLQAAPFGFDASTLEIWGPLLNGGCCVLHAEAIPSARGLARTIRAFQVNTAWLTSALFNSVVDEGPQHLAGLDQLVIGGEALSAAHVRRVLGALPEVRLVNGYGPTESTTFACAYDIPHQLSATTTSIPIGFPITATSARVLNRRLERVPQGFAGELMIGGLGLSEGYLNNPALNNARFILVAADELEAASMSVTSSGGRAAVRLYRSGDRVRRLEDGALEFLGRNDQQIKLRGFRIELSEIDALLAALPGVSAAASMVRHEQSAEGQLTAYVVCPPEMFELKLWRGLLGEQLPQAMVPSAWVRIDALPLTANGKLDRSGLPAPSLQRPENGQRFEAPSNPLEAAIAATFAEVLQIEPIGADDNFFDFGGSSLAVVRAITLLEDELGRVIPVAAFFGNPTPRGIAGLLNDGRPVQIQAKSRAASVSAEVGPGARPGAYLSEPIAIVGMALRLPGADTLEEFWNNLVEGRDSITRFNLGEIDPFVSDDQKNDKDYVAARGVIRDVASFDAEFFGISPVEAELMDPQQRVFLEICWECMEHAGYAAGADYWTQPEAGSVGVFAGVYNASYFQNHVLSHPEKVADFGAFQVMLANEKDYVATRVAHRLNLTGPAVNVFTACSTSLVAIAQAVDSLRLGRCDAALAGGASITCPPNSGYLYQEGSMLSPDGKTRSFDVSAAGTVFSDGAAVVYLKRLSDAIADRDTVHAVIRGVAVNNDGGGKASFTAPSVDGQVKVILAAHQEAGVSAQDISYVEAHGTATPMGDPIEVDALRRAFEESQRRALAERPSHAEKLGADKCFIGSVKSNIGHTVMAAGAAGVIKTALALARQRLPQSLHYSAPNPALRLSESPFQVVAEGQEWPRSKQPRLAGVSSFGVGGTNAHLILQEAPEVVPTAELGADTTLPKILKLSARTPSALKAAAAQLREHLRSNPGTCLHDIAHTLDQGRRHFTHRVAIVAQNHGDAFVQLDPDKVSAAASGKARGPFKTTVFMFPGQGAQYARMGWTLYQSDGPFKAAMERCFDALLTRQSFDLKARLFGTRDLDTSTSGATLSALSETSLTQPALFTIEYALAQSWIARGLRPSVLLGHSVGEFVAAALAGVMSLEDAVCLVARRGALMQSMPPGRMLAVRQSAQALASSLPEQVTMAVENSPNSIVLAGPEKAIEAYRLVLEARGISARLLETSHAFHSAMMEPAVALFEQELSKVVLRAPSLPIMSTATARWLTDEEAVQTSYWAQHLRLPVLFASAVSALLKETDTLFVELGPRSTLTNLVRQQLKPAHASVALGTLGDECATETVASLGAVARLWTMAVKVSAELGPASSAGRRVPLPSYPFERRRYWLDAAAYAPQTPLKQPALQQYSIEKMVTATPQSSVSRRPQTIQELGQLFESVSGMDFTQADPEQSFAELGLDSLILTQVSLQIKRKFSIKITFRELMESYRSLNALAEHVERSLPAPNVAQVSASTSAVAPSASVPAARPEGFAAGSTPALPITMDAGLTNVLQQQVLLMQRQLELLCLGSGVGGALGAGQLNSQPMPMTVSPSARITSSEMPASGLAKALAPAPVPSEVSDTQTYDVKKAFGAIARIHTTRTADLTTRQRTRLDALISRYVARTQASKTYTARHRGQLADPRVVNGFRPALKEMIYQIVIEKSAGAHLWDLDGNRYVDALNGFGMSLFGWQPPFVTEALRKQLDLGYEIGPQHPLAGEVAQQICDMTGFERAAFCNTGSEAVMGAIRIARTVTGRHLIVSFSGAYHGIFDEVVVRGTKSLRTIPAAPGIMANVGENVLVLEYGSEEALRIIAERSEDIAAVLVEPVQSRRPDFQPKEFLKSLRTLTERSGIALVFDEVVTGFRSHPGGVQSLFGIRADLATYGKVIGGGLSIGVVAGKREYMDALDGGDWQYGDESIPTVGVTYFAGTFVRHPLALAAAHVVLKHLKEQGPTLQETLNSRTAELCEAMNAFCKTRGAPIELRYFSSVWRVVFLEEHPYQDLLFAMMRSRGVHILDNFPCFMTTAHQAEDLSFILEAFKDSVIELQEATFLPGRQEDAVNTLDANQPPVPGARLGRNRAGQVAWFVENPAESGKYVEMK
jgi:amino acid adenylation domain-containing protein